MGNKWSEIAHFFPGKNDNFIKNCFYSAIRRNLRKYNKNKVPSKQLKGTILSLLKKSNSKKILMNFPEHENPELYAKQPQITVENKEEVLINKNDQNTYTNKHKCLIKDKIIEKLTETTVEINSPKTKTNDSPRKSIKKPANLQIVKPQFIPAPQKTIDEITPNLNFGMMFGIFPDDIEMTPDIRYRNPPSELLKNDSTKSDTLPVPNYIFPDYSPQSTFQHYFSPRNSNDL